jgi:uncharacterized protein GlcG (DUF336 family)
VTLFHNPSVKHRAGILFALFLAGCSAFGQMSSNQVATVIAQALTRANDYMVSGTTSNGVVAVVDREGFVLGAWSLAANPSPLDIIDAITKAGTAAFLSSEQEALTSRSAGFIVQQHFPPGIKNTAPGPLVGVNFSNLSFSDVNYFKDPHAYDPLAFGGGGTNGAPIVPLGLAALSGLAGSPGGVPLYDTNGHLLGGVGVAVTGHGMFPELSDIQLTAKQRPDVDEDVALAGQIGFAPAKKFFGSQVLIGGIRLPYVSSKTVAKTPLSLGSVGFPVAPYDVTNSPPVNYPTLTLGGVPGEMRAPIVDDPAGGLIAGQARLSAAEVTNILTLSAQRAAMTRAGIRLPRGQAAQVFVTVVNNPNSPGVAPTILGTFRSGGATNGATMFSWDVAAQKARTALFFSSPLAVGLLPTELQNKALSTRAIGFLAQSMYPPGIQRKPPGPLLGFQENFSLLPTGVTNILDGVYFTVSNPSLTAPDPNLPNGITIFPGGFPLYRNGVLIGAIGVSGDGVDQDDLVAASGTVNFLAPPEIRSDRIIYRGTRLPYAKFPRNPSL